LTGLPPTVLGELGIKWLELFQTGLPITALSSTVGSLRLSSDERKVLFEHYIPWALTQSQKQNSNSCFLMNVYYEKEFDTPLDELRARLQIQPAPKHL
jgi:ubiquinone biosynthesis protein COQ4